MSAYNDRNAHQKDHTKQYLVLGIVIAILVVALLIWNSGYFQKTKTAATVGEETFTVAEMDYYYHVAANSTINNAQMYEQYGISSGYDTSLSPEEQKYDEESGKTYADYFKETALTDAQRVTILNQKAKEAGYELSEEGKKQIETTMSQLTMYSVQSGYSESAYLKLLYGPYMDKGMFKRLLEESTLASDYAQARTEEFTYTDEQLDTYYQEHKAELDTYDYRYTLLLAETESKQDAEGNPVEPTAEETAAAKAVAEEKANAMSRRIKAGEAFNTVAVEYVAADSKASYQDPEYNHTKDTLGANLSGIGFGSWLMEDGRKKGEVTVIPANDTGFYVVQFLGRTQDNESYQSMDVRNILIPAEITEAAAAEAEKNATEKEVTETDTPKTETTGDATVQPEKALPTEEQLAAAKQQAEDILEQWKANGGTAEAFATLATENSKDEESKANGGLRKAVERNTMSADANTWIFETGRAVGDAVVVPNQDENGDVTGYQVLYLDALGQIRWRSQATNTLRSADYDAWYAELETQTPAAAGDGMAQVGAKA